MFCYTEGVIIDNKKWLMLLGFRCIMRRGDGASCRLLCRFSFHTARHRSTRPSSPTISSPPPHSGLTLCGEARTLAGDRCFRCDQERNALVLGFDVGSKTRHIWICRPRYGHAKWPVCYYGRWPRSEATTHKVWLLCTSEHAETIFAKFWQTATPTAWYWTEFILR